jgi:hypothetical protein
MDLQFWKETSSPYEIAEQSYTFLYEILQIIKRKELELELEVAKVMKFTIIPLKRGYFLLSITLRTY